MFCTNCGREIIDTARFCNFCGTPIQNMAASIPIQPVQPEQPVQPVQPAEHTQEQPFRSATEFSENTDIPAAENTTESAPEKITENADNADAFVETEAAETDAENKIGTAEETIANSAVPTPNTIPTYGTSDSVYSAPPAYPTNPTMTQTVNTIPVQSAEIAPESKPERKYTLGHIMMCLAAVAVMAIVAGVFAGLYFSVV